MTTTRITGFESPDDGDLTVVTVDGTEVAVAKVGGELYAFQDECTHQQCSLSDGEIDGRTVVCPCHLGTFDITTGAVVSGPPDTPLRTWSATMVEGDLELDG